MGVKLSGAGSLFVHGKAWGVRSAPHRHNLLIVNVFIGPAGPTIQNRLTPEATRNRSGGSISGFECPGRGLLRLGALLRF